MIYYHPLPLEKIDFLILILLVIQQAVRSVSAHVIEIQNLVCYYLYTKGVAPSIQHQIHNILLAMMTDLHVQLLFMMFLMLLLLNNFTWLLKVLMMMKKEVSGSL